MKIARNAEGRALYFSRAPIPHARGLASASLPLSSEAYLRHIGVYAFTPAALARWMALPETHLENVEKIEVLRPLAGGMSVGVAITQHTSIGIDTPADLERAEQLMRRENA